MGFLEALQLVFIAMKLLGFIDWSWWWVLSPLMGSLLLYVAVICLVLFRVPFAVPRSIWSRLKP